jgi:hypothetical protein
MNGHPSDHDLLFLVDRELPPWRIGRVDRHVAKCAVCQRRVEAIHSAFADAAELQAHAAPLPPAADSRARLLDLLQHAAVTRSRPRYGGVRECAFACAMLVAVAGGAWFLAGSRESAVSADRDARPLVFLLPNADLTPGLVQLVTVADVCGETRYGRTHPIAAAVHEGVFRRYGADPARSSEYELDYLITPELGGVADARNLWPQPFAGTAWNAYVKDELELHLHRLVCKGALDFATAQRELTSDWIAAYKRRFNTDTPLRDYAKAPLTERDEDFIRAELEELGTLPDPRADAPTLMALWQLARTETAPRP